MADPNQQETGGSLMVIGWLMALFALGVMFFHPAANGIGRTAIDLAAIALVAGGIACNAVGYYVRGKAH
jgi:uncharacterized membrane-anchored protein